MTKLELSMNWSKTCRFFLHNIQTRNQFMIQIKYISKMKFNRSSTFEIKLAYLTDWFLSKNFLILRVVLTFYILHNAFPQKRDEKKQLLGSSHSLLSMSNSTTIFSTTYSQTFGVGFLGEQYTHIQWQFPRYTASSRYWLSNQGSWYHAGKFSSVLSSLHVWLTLNRFYGISLAQTVHYYRTFSKDRWSLRFLVSTQSLHLF